MPKQAYKTYEMQNFVKDEIQECTEIVTRTNVQLCLGGEQIIVFNYNFEV